MTSAQVNPKNSLPPLAKSSPNPKASRQKTTVYLDYAATTPLIPDVFAEMEPYLSGFQGNPSTLYALGQKAKQALETSRQRIAACLNTTAETLYFTSGATEADNWVIFGLAKARESVGKHIITTAIEHSAIAEPVRYLEEQRGYSVTWLPVNKDGFVSLNTLKQAVRSDTAFVSIIYGNNEIGTLQPVDAIGAFLREKAIPFHTDAVQVLGKLPIDLQTLPVDYMSLSAHKCYGPRGIGALYVHPDAVTPSPLVYGGSQESGLRAGTENVPAAVGFAAALAYCTKNMPLHSNYLRTLQHRFIETVQANLSTAELNGPSDLEKRVPGNVHFSFPPLEGDTLVLKLGMRGISISSGSACRSAVIEPSRIVQALGKPDEIARSTARFSLGYQTTADGLDYVLSCLKAIVK
ncbi:MAG: cysteine desulfurase family protein [Cyanobacteria bacterium P01_H01_bin.74]